MTRLEDRLKQMEDAFNTNTKAFSDGIQMLEANQEVLRRVLQDVFNGEVRVLAGAGIPIGDGTTVRTRIDFNGYLGEFISELVAKEAMALEKPVIINPADVEDQPVIFGGGA